MAEQNSIRKRASMKGWLTRAINSLDQVLQDADSDRIELEEGISELNKRLNNFEEAQSEVELSLTNTEELEADIQTSAVIYDQARRLKVQSKRKLSKLNSDDESKASDSHSSSARLARLPKIELPKFKGDVTKFPEFWDQFSATIDESDIPVITKFTYLKSLLEGEAKSTIDGLSLTQQHYKVACDILKDRFGRHELIVFSHIQSLLNLKPEEKLKDSLSKLKNMMDKVNVHVRSLEALGIDGSTYGVTLTPVILSRLPLDVRMEWARESKGKESNLEWLLEFLQKEIERRERADTFQINKYENSDNVEERTPTFNRKYRGSATALHSLEQGESECAFCQKSNHTTDSCWSGRKLSLEERKSAFVKSSLCFRCSLPGHAAKGCNSKCSKCGFRHHKWLCTSKNKFDGKPEKKDDNAEKSNHTENTNVSLISQDVSQTVVLQVVKVTVQGSHSKKDIYALFDSGSDKTYVTSDLVKKLKMKPISYVNHRYAVFGGGKSTEARRSVVKVNMMSGAQKYEVQAVEIPVICSPIERPQIPKEVLERLGIPISEEYNRNKVKVDMLIGLDNYWKLISNKVLRIEGENLVAQESVFGYVLSGAVNKNSGSEDCVSPQLLVLNDLSEDEVRRFWEIEHIGILPTESRAENEVLKNFKDTIKYEDNRYVVALPWKNGMKEQLRNNEKSALERAKRLEYKLSKNPDLKEEYLKIFHEWEESGIIEEVPENESGLNPEYYLPHRPVVKADHISTKIRPVFDASASSGNGVSLNDCLHTGPNLLPDLIEVLIRFRRHKVALNSDVKKAFLQICLKKAEKDVHRFILLDGEKTRKMRFCRVTFGNKSSPFLLNATIKHHLNQQSDSKAVEELKENLYMDDWLSGADDSEEASKMYDTAKSVMKTAGMELTKWHSNEKEILAKEAELPESVKVLGVRWSSEDDVFLFDGMNISKDVIVTKRVVLSVLARIFDPLGFIAPVVMSGKILFQQLWRLGIDWDDEIPPDLLKGFKEWIANLESLKNLAIPRRYFQECWNHLQEAVELHVFADSSEAGYGAVIYLRIPEDEQLRTILVMSKARVTPLKKITLPRLELLACLLAARLLCFVRDALRIPKVKYTCYTDSQIALGWIKSDPYKYKPFVTNRVEEIQKLTDPRNWNHVPGIENPADLLTRGLTAKNLVSSEMWLHGPSLLINKTVKDSVEIIEPPIEEIKCNTEIVLSCTSVDKNRLFDIKRWSSFNKALRIVMLILRFVQKLKKKHCDDGKTDNAKLLLIIQDQMSSFPEELKLLQDGKCIPKTSRLFKLNPFIGEENGSLLRVKGRIQKAEVAYSMKHPIIIDKGWLAKLIVRDYHERMNHAGVDTIITAIRNLYWIIGLRRIVKRVIQECMYCQRMLAGKCNQTCAPLPLDRLVPRFPFCVSGVDYAGPVYVNDDPERKFYICLFTCATTRAVHLELSSSLSTADFILAFRRFVARRSLPSVMYSDNAKTFSCAEKKVKEIYGHCAPTWKFIVPRAPWWGGWWERMVRSVKLALRKCLRTSIVSKDELVTLLIEIENTVNSRPLTQVTDEVDNEVPITPNDFLVAKNPACGENLFEILEARKQLLLKFWKIWSTSYLQNLPKIVPHFKEKGQLRNGALVLIQDDNLPRLCWPLGRIMETIPSADGKIRSAKVKTAKGQLIRPVQRLCYLEAISGDLQNEDDETSTTETIEASPSESDSKTVSDTIQQERLPRNIDTTNLIPKTVTTRGGRTIITPNRLDL